MLRILVEASKILGASDEYRTLRNMQVLWRGNMESNDTALLAANHGGYEEVFHSKSTEFTSGTMTELDDQVNLTINVLDNSYNMVKGLIARCVDFASVLEGEDPLGNQEYESAGTNGVDVLLFEDQYCSEEAGFSGAILDTTDEIDTLSTKENEDISGITKALSHLQTINVNVSGNLSAISDCTEKQKRVVPLGVSLIQYGSGVSTLNYYVASSFAPYTGGYAGKQLGHYRNVNHNAYLTNNKIFLTAAAFNGSYNNFYLPPTPIMPMDYKAIAEIAQKIGATVEEVTAALKGYIPNNWSNDQMVAFLDAISHGRAVSAVTSWIHENHNKDAIKLVYTEGEYIENQNAWTDVNYGLNAPGKGGSMQYSGCELIAIVNALHSMGYDMTTDEVAQLISDFEKDGAVLSGLWGSSPVAIAEYLVDNGYNVTTTTTTDYKELEELADNSDTLIVTVYNDKNDITDQIHTVNIEIRTNPDGTVKYVVHNAGRYRDVDGDGSYDPNVDVMVEMEYDTLQKAIEDIGGGDSRPIQTIGISEPVILDDRIETEGGGISC